jgi:hypothetical protein
MLGFDAPIVPNGETLEDARAPNPELAKAEEDVCGMLLSPLPKIGFSDVDEVFEVPGSSEGVLVLPPGSVAATSCTGAD